MIILDLQKVTAASVISIVDRAIAKRAKGGWPDANKSGFCRVAGLSRNSLNDYYLRKQTPGFDGLRKIAAGLREWGYEVEVKIDA